MSAAIDVGAHVSRARGHATLASGGDGDEALAGDRGYKIEVLELHSVQQAGTGDQQQDGQKAHVDSR